MAEELPPTPTVGNPPSGQPQSPKGGKVRKVVQLFNRVRGVKDCTTWQWQAEDVDGNLVEFASGHTTCLMKCEGGYQQAMAHAVSFLYGARVEACTNGLPDPEYKVVPGSMKQTGTVEGGRKNVGNFRPKGGVPLTFGVGKSYPEPPADLDD
jgi:hypothetical protein